MNVTVELVNASGDPAIPTQKEFQLWATTAMGNLMSDNTSRELSIRVINEDESSFLNQTYRLQQGATNILSFPVSENAIEKINLMGDLAICAPVVRKEAHEQNKTLTAHWAHMIVHGVLHLNGFDHEERDEAEKMESLEIAILNKLGFDDPYH